ncbi:hypothetical protein [Candidatus Tisiphia endosymbiont of Ceraclea dissimilis]|uniref:hypothetical protein n=1 Tax=Candidatus Tisiphia endosymbiont of Ceraclea dissimilis TaxID=3077928 RepID=UPI003CCAC762
MPLEKYVIDQIATNSITPPVLYNIQIDDTKAKELAEALKTNHNIIPNHYLFNNIDAIVCYLR